MRTELKQRGSITLFAVLSMLLVMGFLLTLLEGVRVKELHRMAGLRTQMAVEAVFANYSTVLWENYHLLGCSLEAAEELILQSADSNGAGYNMGVNFLLLELEDMEIGGCTLITDGNGAAYMHAVSSYMKRNILYETAKMIFNQYDSIKHLLDSNQKDGTEIEKALEGLEALEAAENVSNQNTGSSAQSQGTAGGNQKEENPLEEVQRVQKTQLLELVVPDTATLSTSQYDMSQAVSKRTLNEGWNCSIEETEWLDRVLLQQYLLTYFADYSNPQSDRGLQYELEYLIGGADSDIENLRTVVNGLLLIRETANFVYLMSDSDKVLQVELLATILGGVTAQPELIEVVKIGLLLAWAFAESVLDVRALLQGKKIPLIKGEDTWTLALENIGTLEEEYLVAKESEMGISYKTYLGILLLLQEDKQLAYRAMDVQEISMQAKNTSMRMDNLVVRMRVTNTYSAAPVFCSFKTQKISGGWDYRISATAEYGYD